jgi:lactate 2-monooxygenase
MGIAQYTSDPVFRASLAEPLDGRRGRGRPVNLATLRAFAQMVRHTRAACAKLRSGEPRAAVQRFVATYSRPR